MAAYFTPPRRWTSNPTTTGDSPHISIRPGIAEAAHEVRHLGNDMAHGDFAEQVDHEEAELALELVAAILDELWLFADEGVGAASKAPGCQGAVGV